MKEDILKYTVTDKDAGAKLDSILRSKMNLSRRMVTGLKKSNNIFINGKRSLTNTIVSEGDEVAVNLIKDESQDIEPEDIPIDIIFEDRDLLIANKQPGIVVHPTKGHPQGTLSNGIIYHWRKNGESNIVRLVNRLDRDTSGLIIIAKNQFTHQAMAKLMDGGLVEKTYTAVVHGVVEKDEGTIDLPIDRPTWESIKREVMETGIRAVTHYRTVERFENASLLEIKLETGKTHQIRVHMTYTGHPLFGDTLYGESDDSRLITRQALHAVRLTFPHPRSGEKLDITAALPEDIQNLISLLRRKE
jgi:pseudouridine synthase, RluA family